MTKPLTVFMLASENDALAGGKVGGIGDVVRELPVALAARNCQTTVITPAYGAFHHLPGATFVAYVEVVFQKQKEQIQIYQVEGCHARAGVRHWVFEHPLFQAGGVGKIYCDDPSSSPFATDASKFALFCLAVAQWMIQPQCETPDVVHVHDWHAAFLLILREYHPAYKTLKKIRCVHSIHNLALQGIRPFSGDPSSLVNWYPTLHFEQSLLADPRWPDCMNAMAAGIRLADAVHVVSPSYAEEILQASEVDKRGYYGGEGLEADLQLALKQGRLVGILNGCDYTQEVPVKPWSWSRLLKAINIELLIWASSKPTLKSAHFVARERIIKWAKKKPTSLLTSVSRITEQKALLLQRHDDSGQPALHSILQTLGNNGVYVFLGSGEAHFETFFTQTSAVFENFIFLNGYSDQLSSQLYAMGDLFLMPSSFEPCGISQMLAMRAGQACLVHRVGGLKDTVQDNINGFAFTGDTLQEQATELRTTVARALEMKQLNEVRWRSIAKAAAKARFLWDDSVELYLDNLYLHE